MPNRTQPRGPVVALSDLTATLGQRRLVTAVAMLQFIAFAITAPYAATPLPRFDAFIPTLEAVIFVNDFITSILLFAQYAVTNSRAFLILAGGYLFTSLIVIPHALTFPDAVTPTGLLGATPQTTAWLYGIWHFVSPAVILAYAWAKDSPPPRNTEYEFRQYQQFGCASRW